MPGESEEADRLLSRARTFESGRLWGKAIDAFREVVAKHPGTPQAKEAQEAVARIEEVLAR